ncbi:MAG: TadE/TadG family type IV pilus assembly protein [Sphingomonadaceae bacterium]
MMARRPRKMAGLAAVEFALLLPILMLLLVGVIDVARAVQANMILINLSREGANLAARGTLQLVDNSQAVIGSVAASAPPLDMNNRGMIYITKVMGKTSGSTTRSVVLEQYRWDDSKNVRGYRVSGYAPGSKIWSCSNWASGSDGTCVVPSGSNAPGVTLMSGSLADGEVIYVVESFYKFNMAFSGFKLGTLSLPTLGPDLYSMTVF